MERIAPGHHGYPRASDLILGQALEGRLGHQIMGRDGETVFPSPHVHINDRGPFIAGRIIDLSKAEAQVIGMTGSGIARVSITILGR